ncbi:MAG: polysaccharide biosynthesis tyrosine autokinase [Myxococcota bacterium]|nr:polysaccharide biosynthesis tyrosine autokinase [Myxococcota bacterium]
MYTKRQPRIYEASTQLVIELNAPRYLPRRGAEVVSLGSGTSWNTKEFFETQYRIIKSRMVAAKVVKTLGLDQDLDFLGVTKLEEADARARRLKNADPISILVSRISVDPVSDSRVALIRVRDENPSRAAKLADAIAQAYAAQNVDRKVSAAIDAVEWLRKQAGELKSELIKAENDLLVFKRQNNILGATLADKQNFVSLDLQDARRQSRDAKRESVQLKAQLDQVRKLTGMQAQSSVSEVLSNGLVQRLKEQLIGLKNSRVELLKRYLEKHPDVLVVDSKIRRVEKSLQREVKGIRQSIERRYKASLVSDSKLRAEVVALEEQAKSLQAHELEYRRRQAAIESKKTLHIQMLSRLKEAQLQAEARANNVRVLDAALVPKAPIRPRLFLNLAVALVLSVFGGIGLAFLVDRLDNTVKSQEQLEAFGLTFLGIVPSVRSVRGKGGMPKALENPDRCVIDHPNSTLAECVRIIRTNLLFMTPEQELRSMLVTSAGPREGKTCTCVNIGATMAMSGSKTLLVDSDLRRPRLHKIFGFTNERGLTNLIMDADAKVEDMAIKSEVDRLDILCSGPLPPNPSEILHTQGFKRTLAYLLREYDRVIFDSPPVGAVTDAQILGQQLDGAVLVVRAGETSRDMLKKAKELLDTVNVRLLGALLNNLDVRRKGYGQYSYQYYSQQTDETTVKQS